MNVTLLLTPPCSSQANRNIEQQLETVTAADGTLQRGYPGAPVPSSAPFLFINGLFS